IMTRWFVALLVMVPLAAWADEPDPEPPGAGVKQLDGEWEMVAAKFKGTERKIAPGSGTTMIIKNGKLTRKPPARFKGKVMGTTSTIKLDPRKSPAHIDITMLAPKPTYVGIYKLEGDELTMSAATTNVNARPKDFESAIAVIVYKRKKK